jgi:hypothetical protein
MSIVKMLHMHAIDAQPVESVADGGKLNAECGGDLPAARSAARTLAPMQNCV